MAKAKAKRGAPMKPCGNPKCDATMHARKRTCDKCGFEFPAPEAKPKAANGNGKNLFAGHSGLDAILSAQTFISERGGIGKAIEFLEAVKTANDWASTIGGIDNALELLRTLKTMGAK